LSSKTIDTYREHLKHKLRLANSAELVQHAVQWVLEGAGG
jgi:DNA-binding CsgD family transcriptional regulator